MSFLQPNLLVFLVLAAIPVVLYIIFRMRRREVPWGAGYILRLTVSQKKKQNIWKQICVIALRTVLLAALVAAFARPFMPQTSGFAGGEYPRGPERLHRIVLIDNSASMMALSGTTTRLDAARAAASRLAVSLRSGDLCEVIAMAPASPSDDVRVVSIKGLSKSDAVSSQIDEITLSQKPINPVAAIRSAIERFRDVAAPQRQLIVVTDLCRTDWAASDELAVFGEQLASLNVRGVTLSLGSKAAANLAIESLTPGSEIVFAGQPTNLYASLANFGDGRSPETALRFFIDGKLDSEQAIALPPGGRKVVVVPLSLDVGTHRIEARLGADILPFDDSHDCFVNARAGVRLLVVTPTGESAQGFEREGAFLERTFLAAEGAPFGLKVTVIDADKLLEQSFNETDAVILAGVDSLPQPTIAGMLRFLRRGGGVLLSVAPGMDVSKFNASFRDLLPATLSEPARSGDLDYDRYTSIQSSDIDTPLLKEFEESRNGELSAARVYSHYRTDPIKIDSADGDAITLLAYSSGAPALLERRIGKGKALLWTTTLGGRWCSLAVHHAYQPMLLRLMNHVVGSGAFPLNVAIGEPLIAPLPEGVESCSITTPDAKLLPVEPVMSGDRRFVRFEGTSTPGNYELIDQNSKLIATFSVHRDMRESDLRMINTRETFALEKSLGAPVVGDDDGLRTSLWRKGDGHERGGWLLAAVMLLVALDAFLTWIWFR